MAAVTQEGIAEPFDVDGQPYPPFGDRPPALRSFYLAYDVGDTSPGDHEIALLQVLAGGRSQDLTPGADLSASNLPDGQLQVGLQDARARDEEFFYRVSHSLLAVPGVRRFQVRDVGCTGQCSLPIALPGGIPNPGVVPPLLALTGFKLFFTGGRDHEILRAGVWFEGHTLHTMLRDKNGDDVFGYLVDFVAIPRMGINVVTGSRSGSGARGGVRVQLPGALPRTDFVLTGWQMGFSNGDHEIREIGVDRQNRDCLIFFSDKNADDPFEWRIDWAHVGPMVLAPPTEPITQTLADQS